MSRLVLSLVCVALLASAASASSVRSTIGDCPQDAAMDDASFVALVNAIQNAGMDTDKLRALDATCKNTTRGFSGPQTVATLELFSFSDSMLKALSSMSPLVLGCTVDEVIEVINAFSFSNDKLKVLPAVMNTIIDPAQKLNIVDQCFSFSSDKDAAKKILEGLIPRSCVFGTVTEPRVQFLIDVSGSMSEKFTLSNVTASRISYVTNEMVTVLTKQLQPSQKFNVFSFSDGVTAWQPGLVPVKDDTINSAVKFCTGLRANGGTNIYGALQRAFADPDVVAIYLLTDGFPSVGVTDINKIIADTAQMSSKHNPRVKVNTIALTAGGSESPADREKAKFLMEQLAKATGGVYRNIN